jgi:hypothetical protein
MKELIDNGIHNFLALVLNIATAVSQHGLYGQASANTPATKG